MSDLIYRTLNTTAATSDVWTVATNYVYSDLGLTLKAKPTPAPTPLPETPEQWLRRRVAEVCWTPA